MEKLDIQEKVIAFILGIIAIIAVIFEMVIAGFELSSVAGGIKDIAGTILDVIMLVLVFRAFLPKKKTEGFQDRFNLEIEKIIQKYSPVITFFGIESTKKIQDAYRYNIANKLDCISTKVPGGNNKFFRVKKGVQEIEFSVSQTVFSDRKEAVASRIASRIKDSHNEYIEDAIPSNEGFILQFKSPLLNEEDAVTISQIIDHILLLYIAEYKK